MNRRFIVAALVIGLPAAGCLNAQSAAPSFEVASIKLNNKCDSGGGGARDGVSPNTLSLPCMRLRGLIRMAYNGGLLAAGAKSPLLLEVKGGPNWLDTDPYDVSAKSESNASSDQMTGPMLQALLEERFKVRVHKESKEAPVYALTVEKGGTKLHPAKDGDCTPMNLNDPRANLKPGDPMPKICGSGGGRMGPGGVMVTDWYGVSMAEFAGRMLAGRVDRPVIDKTGLTGRFDVHLEFVSEPRPGAVQLNGVYTSDSPAPASDARGPSIVTALQEQLGLKLSPASGSVEVIVVDHAERPTEN